MHEVQDGKVDTLHILFSTVQNIYVQASDLIEADVLLKLSESPILGDQSMSVAPGDLSASWKIKKTGLNAFRKALMHRKVVCDCLGRGSWTLSLLLIRLLIYLHKESCR